MIGAEGQRTGPGTIAVVAMAVLVLAPDQLARIFGPGPAFFITPMRWARRATVLSWVTSTMVCSTSSWSSRKAPTIASRWSARPCAATSARKSWASFETWSRLAISAFARASRALGDEFSDYFAISRRWELKAWQQAVSDWERERYERTV